MEPGLDVPLWVPGEGAESSRLAEFSRWVQGRRGLAFAGYHDLWRWSVHDLSAFWADVAEFFGVADDVAADRVLTDERMPGAIWFPDESVNFAAHVLAAFDDDDVAIIATTERGPIGRLDGRELRRQVGALASTLRGMGVEPGDRVAGYLPNIPQAVVAFLATASLGAVWTVCAPDFGVQSVLDRLAQTEPKVLVAADGYHFGGRVHDRTAAALEVLAGLPSSPRCIWVDHVGPPQVPEPSVLLWDAATAGYEQVSCLALPFDHPLWILFSSGTTGVPKGIVHGHGGVLLEQLKMLGLLSDVRRGDTFFWYTSTAWMMWNVVVSSLLLGARAVLHDGSPQHPGLDAQWALAERLGVTHLGTSAGYLTACALGGLDPGSSFDLSSVRYIGSTGSPLPADTARWVYGHVLEDVHLVSSTGGTDVATGFLAGAPTLPVWAGELSGPMLGVAVDSYDEQGLPVRSRDGELVVTRPMPSMPLYFWNDPDGSRYHDAYFSTYPGVWRHGDWLELTDRGTAVVSGRSDSTLNRGGVRLGTADVYSALGAVTGVVDSLMLGVEQADGTYWMPLFVQLADGTVLDEDLTQSIRSAITTHASRRHLPDEIIPVPGIPYTRTGKRLEVPIKHLFQGRPVAQVVSAGSISDPSLIEVFRRLAQSRGGIS